MNEELELLRNVQAQYYESLKMKKEHETSEKSDTSTSETALADYENFQILNQNMQQEILQLRSYIEQQQNMIQVRKVRTTGNSKFWHASHFLKKLFSLLVKFVYSFNTIWQ